MAIRAKEDFKVVFMTARESARKIKSFKKIVETF